MPSPRLFSLLLFIIPYTPLLLHLPPQLYSSLTLTFPLLQISLPTTQSHSIFHSLSFHLFYSWVLLRPFFFFFSYILFLLLLKLTEWEGTERSETENFPSRCSEIKKTKDWETHCLGYTHSCTWHVCPGGCASRLCGSRSRVKYWRSGSEGSPRRAEPALRSRWIPFHSSRLFAKRMRECLII